MLEVFIPYTDIDLVKMSLVKMQLHTFSNIIVVCHFGISNAYLFLLSPKMVPIHP